MRRKAAVVAPRHQAQDHPRHVVKEIAQQEDVQALTKKLRLKDLLHQEVMQIQEISKEVQKKKKIYTAQEERANLDLQNSKHLKEQ